MCANKKGKKSFVLWAKPYDNDKITNINTGLTGQWRYSPSFDDAIATTWVALTGYRRKDYKIAEKQVGIRHEPGRTLWHHVWRMNAQNEVEMQLVETRKHQKSCPHAGGCKLWLLNNGRKVYKRHKQIVKAMSIVSQGNYAHYSDYEIEYLSSKSSRTFLYNSCLANKRHRKLRIIGMDAYGNVFFENRRGVKFVFDHEFDNLRPLKKK